MHYHIAKPGEFIFKRDSNGVETVETQGLVIGTVTMPGTWPVLEMFDDASIERSVVQEATMRALDAGFWSMGRPVPTMSPVAVAVTVQV